MFTYLTMRPVDGVAYGLSNLVELIISCRSPVLTLCEQYSYFSIVFHVQPIRHFDSIDYVLISSVSHSSSFCIDGRI